MSVSPASLRLAPGRSATFRVVATGPERTGAVDDGWVTWVSSDGTRARIPVVLTR